MKTESELYDLGRSFVEETYPKQDECSFHKNHAVYCFVSGHEKGYEEGFSDANSLSSLAEYSAKVKRLSKKAEKVGLFLTVNINLTYNTPSVSVYDTYEGGKIKDCIFQADRYFQSNTLAKFDSHLESAEAFIDKYAEDSVENLTKQSERLTRELKSVKNQLSKAKRAVAKK